MTLNTASVLKDLLSEFSAVSCPVTLVPVVSMPKSPVTSVDSKDKRLVGEGGSENLVYKHVFRFSARNVKEIVVMFVKGLHRGRWSFWIG